MLRNLYIRKGDESFWNRAEERAAERGVPLSVYVSDLLRNHIYDAGSGQVKERTPSDLLNEIESLQTQLRALLVAQAPDPSS